MVIWCNAKKEGRTILKRETPSSELELPEAAARRRHSGAGHSIYWVGARRGFALGLVLAVVEMLKCVPAFLKFQHHQPVTVTLIGIAFNLIVGILVGSLGAPLLKLRTGWLWHYLWSVSLIVALLFAARTPFDIMLRIDAVVAGGVVLLYSLGGWLARRPWRAWIAVALSGTAMVVGYGLPYWIAPPPTEVKEVVGEWRSEAPAGAPNVLFIVLDTVRADRLDVMGYHRPTFPWLRTFAGEGATFQRAVSAAPWTLPSHASMFTGLFPSGHGAHHESRVLDDSQVTLAEIFSRHGWTTLALSSNPWISRSTGLLQGFAYNEPVWIVSTGPIFSLAYRVAWHVGLLDHDHSGRLTTETWLRWLDAWPGDRPFFTFLNYVEPHIPYHQLPSDHLTTFAAENVTRKEIIRASQSVMIAEVNGDRVSAEVAQRVNDLYDAAIHYQGDLVMEAIDALRVRGILDETIVIVVSDHGDLLGEHDMFVHTRSLSEYLLAVPLIIRYPPRVPPGLAVETPVTTAAIMPTVLDLAGLSPPDSIHTRSFASLFDGDLGKARSPLLAEQYGDLGHQVAPGFQPRNPFDRLRVRYRSFEEEGWKLVVDSEGSHWLFRPREAPMESENLAADHPQIVERLMAKLSTVVEVYGLGPLDGATPGPAAEFKLDPLVRARLAELGYGGW